MGVKSLRDFTVPKRNSGITVSYVYLNV